MSGRGGNGGGTIQPYYGSGGRGYNGGSAGRGGYAYPYGGRGGGADGRGEFYGGRGGGGGGGDGYSGRGRNGEAHGQGGRGGGGRGGGRGYRDQETPATVSLSPLTEKMWKDAAGLTSSRLGSPTMKATEPPRRPGFGSVGEKCVVRANHFLVQASDLDFYHYDVIDEVPIDDVL
ncbi:hypothetical protein V2J09_006391 [Rumex salicifolius]